MLDLGESVSEQTTDHLLRSVHHVPVGNDLSLFRALVPDRTHDEESGLADSLENTKQSSDGNERRECEADRVQAQDGRPGQNVVTKVLGDWHTLNDPVGRVFDDEYSKVNTGG